MGGRRRRRVWWLKLLLLALQHLVVPSYGIRRRPSEEGRAPHHAQGLDGEASDNVSTIDSVGHCINDHDPQDLQEGGVQSTAGSSRDFIRSSSMVMLGWEDGVPATQHWARCRDCRLSWNALDERPEVDIFDPYGTAGDNFGLAPEASSRMLLSKSRWHGFFHHRSEELHGRVLREAFNTEASCDVIEERPVFVVPMITWHVGHLLIDLLEPLYQNMIEHYGEVDLDSLIYLDVSRREERETFAEALEDTVYGDSDTPFGLLRLFTRNPLRTVDQLAAELRDSKRRVCFRDLHLGLDISQTYTAAGNHRPPGVPLDMRYSREGRQLQRRYHAFRSFILDGLQLSHQPVSGDAEHVVIIERSKAVRRLTNIEEVVVAAHMALGPNVTVERVAFEALNFTEQLEALGRATVLISQYGTAAHNVLFMRPGAALVLLLQPGWCDWRWHYTDQARLSGVHALSYCHGLDAEAHLRAEHEQRFRWAERAWRQGPWYSKDRDFAVDPAALRDLLRRVPQVRRLHDVAVVPPHSVQASSPPSPATTVKLASTLSAAAGAPAVGDTRPPADEMLVAGSPSFGTLAPPPLVTPPPPIRTSLVLDGIFAHANPPFKLKIVPEVIVWGHDLVQLEKMFEFCVEVLVMPTDSISQGALPERGGVPLCRGEEAFNEFSTIDMHVDAGRYVVRSWLRYRSTQACSPLADQVVPDSEGYLAVSTDRNASLDVRIFDTLPITLSTELAGSPPSIVSVRLNPATAMSLDVSRGCMAHGLNTLQCAMVTYAATQRAWEMRTQLLDALPPIQAEPTPDRPFIFYHLEKSGGSTLRAHLARSALRLGRRFFVPCYDDEARLDKSYLLCYKWNLKSHADEKRRAELAVVAGHFQWDIRDELPSVVDQPGCAPPMCFTVLRDPVDRVISFYYERVMPFTGKAMNDLEPHELEYLLKEFYGSAYSKFRDEGMSNAACKLFCDAQTHHGLDPLGPPPPEPPLLNITLAKARLSTCLVGIQEDWSAIKNLLGQWVPWLNIEDRVRENTGNWAAERARTLRPELLQLILQYNECDVELYRSARVLFARQMHRSERVS